MGQFAGAARPPDIAPDMVSAPLPDSALLKGKYLSGTVCEKPPGRAIVAPEMASAPLPNSALLKDKYLSRTVCESRRAGPMSRLKWLARH